jgi:hypothetical protein
MSITKLYAGVVGDPLNTTGPVLAASVNQLIDTHVSHLKALPTAANAQTDTVYNVVGFYAAGTKGGGRFVWNPTISKSNHDAVLYHSPESLIAWDGTRSGLLTLVNWTGAGNGVWVRLSPEYHINEIGGGDGSADDSALLQRILNSAPPAQTVSIAGAKCVIDSDITVTDLRTLTGDWKNPDMAGPANAQYFNVATSAIYLNSAATINVSGLYRRA